MQSTSRPEHVQVNRWVLTFYWLLAILILTTYEMVYLYATGGKEGASFSLIPPALLKLALIWIMLLGAAELLLHLVHRFMDYLLLVVGFLFALALMWAFAGQLAGLYMSLVIPVILSLFYFNVRLLWFSGSFTFAAYMLLLPFADFLQLYRTPYDLLGAADLLIGALIVGHVILRRGRELQDSLMRAVHSETAAFADSIASESASKYDFLTGLYNHLTFQEYLTALISQNESYGMPLQLAILDIDDFKTVNDTLGHRFGDQVLQKAADLLNASTSIDDVVARYGGEEFVILLTGKTPDKSLALLEDIRASFADLTFDELGEERITVSIGMADYTAGLGREGLFKRTDALLYEAKRSGKNKTVANLGRGPSYEKVSGQL